MSQARLMLTMGRVYRQLGHLRARGAAPASGRSDDLSRAPRQTKISRPPAARTFSPASTSTRAPTTSPSRSSSAAWRSAERRLGDGPPPRRRQPQQHGPSSTRRSTGPIDAEPLLSCAALGDPGADVGGGGSAEVCLGAQQPRRALPRPRRARTSGALPAALDSRSRSRSLRRRPPEPGGGAQQPGGRSITTRGEAELGEKPAICRALEISEKVLGTSEHPNVATNLNNLAEHYRILGDYPAALPLYERGLTILEAALGPDHPSVAVLLSNLADLHLARGELERAEPLYERAIAIQEEALGGDDPGLAVTLDHLAGLRRAAGDRDVSEDLYRRALTIQEAALGTDHPGGVLTRVGLAALLVDLGRLGEAESLLVDSRTVLETVLAEEPQHRRYRSRLAAVDLGRGELYRAMGDTQRAADAWRRALDSVSSLSAGTATVTDLHTRAMALARLGRADEAATVAAELDAMGWRHPDFVALSVTVNSPSPTL